MLWAESGYNTICLIELMDFHWQQSPWDIWREQTEGVCGRDNYLNVYHLFDLVAVWSLRLLPRWWCNPWIGPATIWEKGMKESCSEQEGLLSSVQTSLNKDRNNIPVSYVLKPWNDCPPWHTHIPASKISSPMRVLHHSTNPSSHYLDIFFFLKKIGTTFLLLIIIVHLE